MVRFAFGSQTVGSTIRPAAYCGVVGYKPSFGTLSRSGMKMGAESLDTVGVIARSVDDALSLRRGAAAAKRPHRKRNVESLAVCRSPNWHQMSREGADAFLATVDGLGGQGARIFEKCRSTRSTRRRPPSSSTRWRGLSYEMAHHRASESDARAARRGGPYQYAEYAKALAYAGDCRKRLVDLMGDVDAILTPSTTGEAPLGLESTGNTAMNRLWTLLYGPCVTVPAGVGPAGMPLGVQLAGLPGTDARTLAAARWVESALLSTGRTLPELQRLNRCCRKASSRALQVAFLEPEVGARGVARADSNCASLCDVIDDDQRESALRLEMPREPNAAHVSALGAPRAPLGLRFAIAARASGADATPRFDRHWPHGRARPVRNGPARLNAVIDDENPHPGSPCERVA